MKAKRPINLLSIDVAPLAVPSDLPSGEVDSEPNTPTTICPAYGVHDAFSPNATTYVVVSPQGPLPVIRITDSDQPDMDRLAEDAAKEKENLRKSISPSGGRDFTGKMCTVGNRLRGSADNIYPSSRVTRANTVREARTVSADRAHDDQNQREPIEPKLHNKRGLDGKFIRK